MFFPSKIKKKIVSLSGQGWAGFLALYQRLVFPTEFFYNKSHNIYRYHQASQHHCVGTEAQKTGLNADTLPPATRVGNKLSFISDPESCVFCHYS